MSEKALRMTCFVQTHVLDLKKLPCKRIDRKTDRPYDSINLYVSDVE